MSRHCSEHLHSLLAEQLKQPSASCAHSPFNLPPLLDPPAILGEALKSTFLNVDAEVAGRCIRPGRCSLGPLCRHKPVAEELMGSTALVSLVSRDYIFVTNCGDSRAVLARDGRAIPLSTDHKVEWVALSDEVFHSGSR